MKVWTGKQVFEFGEIDWDDRVRYTLKNGKRAEKVRSTCYRCGRSDYIRSPRDRRNETRSGLCRPCAYRANRGTANKWYRSGETILNGYRYLPIYRDDPLAAMVNKSKRVAEHRYVMAQHIGRPLSPFEHVHHIDGDKLNNAIGNLELITPEYHILITRCETRIKQLEALLVANGIDLPRVI